MNPRKFWLHSKTVWFHLGVAAAGSWAAVEAAAGHLKESMSPEHYGILLAVIGFVGVALRLVTTVAVSLRK